MSRSLVIIISLTSVAAIGYCPQLSFALVHIPWLIVDEDGCGQHCHSYSSVQECVISHINGNISSILTELMRVSQCGDGLWYRVTYINE